MQPEVKCLSDIWIRWERNKPARLIATAGTKVKILHDGGTALVVQNAKGERFSCMTNQTDYKNAY